MSDNEREIRAFEAIIVSQLRRERDPMNLDDLSELTESQRTKINALPDDLIDTLWDNVDDEKDDFPAEEECSVEDLEEELVGMNRAGNDEMDEETRKALDEARKEIIESMRKQRNEQDGAQR